MASHASSSQRSDANQWQASKATSSKANSNVPSKNVSSAESDNELKTKSRMVLLQFLLEENINAQSPAKVKTDRASLPTSLQESAREIQRQQKQLLEMQAQEAKNFFRIGDVAEGRFLVTSKLKEGEFGQVYKVIDKTTKQEMALKVEKNTSTPESGENIEGVVLKTFQNHPNCPKLYATGATPEYNFIAMQLLGENMSDIRRSCPMKPPRLSISAAYRSTMQCLRSIQGLHEIGYLHRDVKPSNFAVGKEQWVRQVVYMLDFGLCRRYCNPDGTPKKARDNNGFRGTVRYASLAAHDRRDLGRCDDLWSLFYTFVELLTGQLPWRTTNDKDTVASLKRKYSYHVLCQVFPPEVGEYCRTIDKLGFHDTPNYDKLNNCLAAYLPKIKANADDPYDWEVCDCVQLAHWAPPK